jgi:hypothetical protein
MGVGGSDRETYDRGNGATITGVGGGVKAEGKDIEVLEIDFDDALAMVRDGRVADGKTIMLLQWAALDGPFRSGH